MNAIHAYISTKAGCAKLTTPMSLVQGKGETPIALAVDDVESLADEVEQTGATVTALTAAVDHIDVGGTIMWLVKAGTEGDVMRALRQAGV